MTHIQVRVREEDAEHKPKPGDWKELPPRELPNGHLDTANGGERFELFFGDHTGELESGKSYGVSLRVGTGTRFSLWSAPVGPVLLAFPPPKKALTGFHVVPDSMTIKCKWTSFSTPKEVHLLEYRIRATPYDLDEDSVGLASTEAYVFADNRELSKKQDLEDTLYGLHPGLKYKVEIACRHPLLGRRDFLSAGPGRFYLLMVQRTRMCASVCNPVHMSLQCTDTRRHKRP